VIAAILIGKEGSTGFPQKNVYPLLGRPMCAYPLLAALEARHVDGVWVSTDSPRIAAIAREHGAEVIDRPAHLATKHAVSEDVYVHAYRHIQQATGQTPELLVLLMANTPTILPATIDVGIEALRRDPTLDSAVTVSCYNMYSPLRARRITAEGILEPFVPFEVLGNPNVLNSNRDSQGDAWFADMGVSVVRPRCLEEIDRGLLPQKWMGRRIHPLRQVGGVDVDYAWQLPHVERWLHDHGVIPPGGERMS
jgi:GTP:adenosylcobinamide-phosphate guanylyltransferase